MGIGGGVSGAGEGVYGVGVVAVEVVGEACVGEVPGFEEDGDVITVSEGAGCVGHGVLRRDGGVEKDFGFGYVGGDDGGAGYQDGPEGGDGCRFDKSMPRCGDHNGVEDDGGDGVATECVGDGLYRVGGVNHANFDGVGSDVGEYGVDLRSNDMGWYRVYVGDADGVLYGDGGNGRGGVTTAGRYGLDIGLYSCSAAGVAAGYGENAVVIHR